MHKYIISRSDTNQILSKTFTWENRHSFKNPQFFKNLQSINKFKEQLNNIWDPQKENIIIEDSSNIRLIKIDIKEFLEVIKKNWPDYDKNNEIIGKNRLILKDYFNCSSNETINSHSTRYLTFLLKGTKCSQCNLKASYFWIEKSKYNSQDKFKANLYGINSEGFETLFTKDHITPKSLGGKSHISNYQTLCITCNQKKSDKI